MSFNTKKKTRKILNKATLYAEQLKPRFAERSAKGKEQLKTYTRKKLREGLRQIRGK